MATVIDTDGPASNSRRAGWWGRMMRRTGDREQGATLVEFALILPVFMALVLGLFSGGVIYNRKITMTDAVREGARFGATLEGAIDDETTWATAVEDRVVALSAGELTAGDVCVDLVLANTTSTCTDAPAAQAEPTVHVYASAEGDLETLFFTTTLTLESSSFGKYERIESSS